MQCPMQRQVQRKIGGSLYIGNWLDKIIFLEPFFFNNSRRIGRKKKNFKLRFENNRNLLDLCFLWNSIKKPFFRKSDKWTDFFFSRSESSFAYEPFAHPVSGKEYVTLTIVHELAHQWIGNLVTPVTWKYSWIKEGLPTYLQYYIVDKVLEYLIKAKLTRFLNFYFNSNFVNNFLHLYYYLFFLLLLCLRCVRYFKLFPDWRQMDMFVTRVIQEATFNFDDSEHYKALEWSSDNPANIRSRFSPQIYNRGSPQTFFFVQTSKNQFFIEMKLLTISRRLKFLGKLDICFVIITTNFNSRLFVSLHENFPFLIVCTHFFISIIDYKAFSATSGAAIFHMMSNILTEPIFKAGIVKFVKEK